MEKVQVHYDTNTEGLISKNTLPKNCIFQTEVTMDGILKCKNTLEHMEWKQPFVLDVQTLKRTMISSLTDSKIENS